MVTFMRVNVEITSIYNIIFLELCEKIISMIYSVLNVAIKLDK